MLFDVLNEFDRLGSALSSAMNGVPAPVSMPMDVRRESDRYVLDADLPGVDPKSIDVSVDGQWLTLRAERSTKPETKDGQWLVRERSDASVVRRIALGRDVDMDHVEANYRDGVLSVVIPIAADARPRRIPVSSGGARAQRVLESQAGVQSADARETEHAAQGKAEPAHSLVH